MANQVYLGDEGFVYNVYDGTIQTLETMREVVNKNKEIVSQLRAQQKAVKLFIPYDTIGPTSKAVRDLAIESLKSLDYDKMAIYSSSTSFSNYFWNLFIMITGKGDKIRLFNSEHLALAWLRM